MRDWRRESHRLQCCHGEPKMGERERDRERQREWKKYAREMIIWAGSGGVVCNEDSHSVGKQSWPFQNDWTKIIISDFCCTFHSTVFYYFTFTDEL